MVSESDFLGRAPGGIAIAFQTRLMDLLVPQQVTSMKWEFTSLTSVTLFPRALNWIKWLLRELQVSTWFRR